jgi:regulator of cell morphogenesis and NO signaling
MHIDPTETVANIALRLPAATRTFERFGIDYGCRGKLPLAAACSHLRLPLREVLEDLEAHTHHEPAAPRIAPGDAQAVIQHLLTQHHAPLRAELTRLTTLAARVASAEEAKDSPDAPVLVGVERLLRRLRSELVPHLDREEREIFPYIAELAAGRAPTPPFRTIHTPLQAVVAQHDEVSGTLAKLKKITNNYHVPAAADAHLRGLYEALGELAHQLQLHLHLENNVLFPLAQRLEQLARGA